MIEGNAKVINAGREKISRAGKKAPRHACEIEKMRKDCDVETGSMHVVIRL